MATITKQKLQVSQFLKMLFVKNGLKTADVAEKLGKTPENLNGILRNGRMNLGTFMDVMDACEEHFTVVLKNGETVELELEKK